MATRQFKSQVFISEHYGPLIQQKLRSVVFQYKKIRRQRNRYNIHLFINGKHIEYFGYMKVNGIEEFETFFAVALELGYRQAVQDYDLEKRESDSVAVPEIHYAADINVHDLPL